jgi:hypothetical protein
MLALFGGKAWYTQQDPAQVGVLDASAAISQTTPVTTGALAAAPVCVPQLPSEPAAVTTSSGQVSWAVQDYAASSRAAGWTIYAMPENSAPWGIRAADRVWLVDQGRQVLARLSPASKTYLPLVMQ